MKLQGRGAAHGGRNGIDKIPRSRIEKHSF